MPKQIRRIVTTSNHETRGILLWDSPSPLNVEVAPGYVVTELWQTLTVPATLPVNAESLGAELRIDPPIGGTVFRMVEVPPDKEYLPALSVDKAFDSLSGEGSVDSKVAAPHPLMHRTETIDYIVIVAGRIQLVLDEGDPITLCPGDVVVQCAANHAWANIFDEPCLFAAVLVDAK